MMSITNFDFLDVYFFKARRPIENSILPPRPPPPSPVAPSIPKPEAPETPVPVPEIKKPDPYLELF